MENSLYKSLIHQTAILKQLDTFRVSGRFCDVTIGAGGKTFKCHRVLLAASSSYFESLFLLGQQLNSDYVTFVPLVSAASFEEILRFIYMAEFTISPENADDLLEAATMLRIQPMIEAISHYGRSFQEEATGASAPHTERSAGSKSKLEQNESQDEGSSGMVKKARVDDKTLPASEETNTTHVQPSLSTQRQLSNYQSRERQQVSKKVYPEACYLTDTSPRAQYDQGATITIKREREDPGYDVATWNTDRPAGSAGNQRQADPEVPVSPDIGEKGRGQWAINKQSLYHDGSRSVLRKENQTGTESTEGGSPPTFRCALEDNVAAHGLIFEEHLTRDKPMKRETPPGMAGDRGDAFTESLHEKSSPAACNTDRSAGQSIGMSAAELLKTLSRRYECAQHQQAQETSDTEVQRARPSPFPNNNEKSETSLFSSWLEDARPPQTDLQKLQSKKQSRFLKVGPDASQFFPPSCLEHRSPPSETRPAQGSVQRTTSAAIGPTLVALLESPASSSPPEKERAAWTGVPGRVHREPTDQYRSPLRSARGPTPQYQHGESPEKPAHTDRSCPDERSSQGGVAQPHDSKRTSPMEPTPRRGGSQSRKSVHKILTRLLTRESYRDTEKDVGSNGNIKDADGEKWTETAASQTLRSMCGEYLTTLPQQRKDDSRGSTIEEHRGDISGQEKERHATLTFPQFAGEGGVLGSASGMSSDGDDNKVKHWTSDKLNLDKEPHASLKDIQGLPRSTETKYSHVATDLPVQGSNPLSATPFQHASPGLLTSSEDTSESVGDDHWLTASETLRRISRTRTLASIAQVADTGTSTEKDTGAASMSAGGLKKQERPGHAGLQSQHGTSIKKEDKTDVSVPDMWQLHQTSRRGRTVGDEDSVIPGWSLRAETDTSLLGPVTGSQGAGKHHTTADTTSQASGKGYAACDILKSIVHYHGQERQDQTPR